MQQHIKADKRIGQNIQKARIAKGLTQEELAAQMQTHGCDISRGTLAKIESGIRHVSVSELDALCIVLSYEYNDFLQPCI